VGAQRALLGLTLAAGLLALVPLLRAPKPAAARAGGAVALAAATGVAAWLGWCLTPVPWGVVAHGRYAGVQAQNLAPGVVPQEDVPREPGSPETYCVYVGEGRNVSVAVTRTRGGVLTFHGAGKAQASTLPADMRLQRMLGHIPALLHPKPKSVLVVACGAGVTAGCFVLHPDVRRIVICDIEPLVPTQEAAMFGQANYDVSDGLAPQ